MQDNIAKRSLHYVLPYGIGANVVRIFYIWKEKGKNLQIKMKNKKRIDKCNRRTIFAKGSNRSRHRGKTGEDKYTYHFT